LSLLLVNLLSHGVVRHKAFTMVAHSPLLLVKLTKTSTSAAAALADWFSTPLACFRLYHLYQTEGLRANHAGRWGNLLDSFPVEQVWKLILVFIVVLQKDNIHVDW